MLVACALLGVASRVRSGGELCDRDCADGEFGWELSDLELFEVDDDGGINDPPPGTVGIRHEGWDPRTRRCRGSAL